MFTRVSYRMTSAFIPNHMIRVSVVAVGTTLHTNPGIQSIGIPQPVGIHPTGVRGLGTTSSSSGWGSYSPHGRAGAGAVSATCSGTPAFAPRACGGWDTHSTRPHIMPIRPTGVWGLGRRRRLPSVWSDSPHGRVGAGRRGMMPVGTRLFIPRTCGGWGASRCYTAYRSIYPRTRGAMIRSCNVRKHRR